MFWLLPVNQNLNGIISVAKTFKVSRMEDLPMLELTTVLCKAPKCDLD